MEQTGWDSIGGAMSTAQLNWISEARPVSAPIAGEYSWYAIQTRVRFEKKVTALLERKGVETFLPLIKQVHCWSDRLQVIKVPLFPGYGFVHLCLNPESRLGVLQTAGVVRFVGRNEALPIPRKQIEDIQRVLAKQVPCAMYPFLKPGRKVRIRGGCLDGLEGVLDERASNKALLISIGAIEKTISIQIEGYDLEVL
jgi:transcription antitermination factor NusG